MLKGNAQYIVRLDDACETQDVAKWSAIEQILDRNKIKPIVAVIPCNEDPILFYNKKDNNFWSNVKRWEEKGWAIAQHGFKHNRKKISNGRALLPLHSDTEFVGLSYQQQCDSIRNGYELFKEHGITPQVWVAPCHTYDLNTLDAIKAVTDIKIVSDGIACYPYSEHGLDFLPQQLWWPKWQPFGIWTICLHPSTMCDDDIKKFDQIISSPSYQGRFIDVGDALVAKRDVGYLSASYRLFFWMRWYLRKIIKNYLKV